MKSAWDGDAVPDFLDRLMKFWPHALWRAAVAKRGGMLHQKTGTSLTGIKKFRYLSAEG